MLHYLHRPATASEVREWCARIRDHPELHLSWDQYVKKSMKGDFLNEH